MGEVGADNAKVGLLFSVIRVWGSVEALQLTSGGRIVFLLLLVPVLCTFPFRVLYFPHIVCVVCFPLAILSNVSAHTCPTGQTDPSHENQYLLPFASVFLYLCKIFWLHPILNAEHKCTEKLKRDSVSSDETSC